VHILSTLFTVVAEEEESLRNWCKDINDANSLDVRHRNHTRFTIKNQVNTPFYLEYIFTLFFFFNLLNILNIYILCGDKSLSSFDSDTED
jgi:hypothetical protein